jgi:predicted metal-dependent HD superfamily phosphohydrolase
MKIVSPFAVNDPWIVAQYSQEHRRYHTIDHIWDCLNLLSKFEGGRLSMEEYDILRVAIIWHDIVYDPKAKPGINERDSALAFTTHSGMQHIGRGLSPPMVKEIVRLIVLTSDHKTDPNDELGGYMQGIDLSILGANSERYANYVSQLREEYVESGAYTLAEFNKGRALFLANMLINADPIFVHRSFHHLEERARINIRQELVQLENRLRAPEKVTLQ